MKRLTTQNKNQVLQWGAFAIFFAYFWRTYNLFTDLPAYGDAVEVVWGILWYNHAFTEWVNPFYYPFMFHPEGWQVGILAHTPLLFTLAQPFYFIGGEVFAFNMLAIVSFFVAYTGSLRFFKHYAKTPLTLIAVSLAFTFIALRSSSAGGHLNFLWATSFLPWLGDQIIRWRDVDNTTGWHKHIWLSGLFWGLMISFTLYSVFLAPVLFLLLGRKLFKWSMVPKLVFVGLVAMLVGSTALLPYYFATRIESVRTPDIQALVFFAESINNLFWPSVYHSVSLFRQAADFFRSNFGIEAQVTNMGFLTFSLILVGLFYSFRSASQRFGHWALLLVGLILALGPMLKYNGNLIKVENLAWLNDGLWQMGKLLKPDVFSTAQPPPEYLTSIPLPDYLFVILIPFWEGARGTARFVVVAFLGALGIVATGLDQLPRWLGILLSGIWLLTVLPGQTGNRPLLANNLHPAHEWLITQPMAPHEGVLDLDNQIIHSAYPLYLSWETKIPTASATGSFRPAQNQFLYDQTWNWPDRSTQSLSRLLQAYDIRYLMIHNDQGKGDPVLNHLQTAPDRFLTVGCFDPPADYVAPWAYQICVVEVLAHETIFNVHPTFGLSDEEPWGIWSIEDQPRFNFIATAQRPYLLNAEVFPNCIEGESQSMTLFYREEVLQDLVWENCDPISFQVTVPAEDVEVGFNEIRIELGYAKSPAELGTGNDPRALGVGFSRLEVRQID